MPEQELGYLKFGHEAMAAPFDILIASDDKTFAGQAAAAAFAEVDAIEKELSRFIASSDVNRINHATVGEPVRIGIHTYECLKIAFDVYKETDDAFDVTIGPLLAAWRNPDKSPRTPSEDELARAREKTGMKWLELDEATHTLAIKKAGVQVDLGGIGKGYAVERAAELLEEWDIESALVDAGDSTVYAMEPPPGKPGWPVGVGGVGDEPGPRRTVNLRRRALSGSGFAVKGRHIIDPRSGKPADSKLAAWSLCPSGTLADALSTAFIVLSPEDVEKYCKRHPDTSAMLILPGEPEKRVLTYGVW